MAEPIGTNRAAQASAERSGEATPVGVDNAFDGSRTRGADAGSKALDAARTTSRIWRVATADEFDVEPVSLENSVGLRRFGTSPDSVYDVEDVEDDEELLDHEFDLFDRYR